MLIIGIIGLSLILFAWLFETVEAVREHKSLVDLRFAVIYLISVVILGVYSWLIADAVFLFLNVALGLLFVLK